MDPAPIQRIDHSLPNAWKRQPSFPPPSTNPGYLQCTKQLSSKREENEEVDGVGARTGQRATGIGRLHCMAVARSSESICLAAARPSSIGGLKRTDLVRGARPPCPPPKRKMGTKRNGRRATRDAARRAATGKRSGPRCREPKKQNQQRCRFFFKLHSPVRT